MDLPIVDSGGFESLSSSMPRKRSTFLFTTISQGIVSILLTMSASNSGFLVSFFHQYASMAVCLHNTLATAINKMYI